MTDVLAGVLPLTEEQRATLRGWYERHAAFYRVDSAAGEVLEVTNLVNDQQYAVMMGNGPQPFAPGIVIFGSLVPWGKHWYWSGLQRQFSSSGPSGPLEIRKSFLRHIMFPHRTTAVPKHTEPYSACSLLFVSARSLVVSRFVCCLFPNIHSTWFGQSQDSGSLFGRQLLYAP